MTTTRIAMAELSRFYGIVISIRSAERGHNRPHIHARYGDQVLVVTWDTGVPEILAGQGAPNMTKLVFQWVGNHISDLQENWDRIRHGLTPTKIAPLR